MEYMENLFQGIDYSQLDTYTQNNQRIRFSDLVWMLTSEGPEGLANVDVADSLRNLLLGELEAIKPMMIQVICIACIFTLGNRFMEGGRIRSSKISFLLIYSMVLLLLLRPFGLITGLVIEGIGSVTSFLTAFIPVYASGLVLTGKELTAGTLTQLVTIVLYLVEWGMKKVMIPMVRFFVFIEFINYSMEEERLGKLADLIEHMVNWILKLVMGIVLGFGSVQSLLAPAKDHLLQKGIVNGASMIPGIGESVESVGEVILGCGMVLKNCIGIAGMLILFGICIFPVVKIWIVNMSYRVLAAVMEPMADKRIVEMTHGIGRALELYLKIFWYSMLMFVILIAIICVTTNS